MVVASKGMQTPMAMVSADLGAIMLKGQRGKRIRSDPTERNDNKLNDQSCPQT